MLLHKALSADLSARPRRLYIEAVRLYHVLSVLTIIGTGTPHLARLRRAHTRAGDRMLRRMIAAPCDVCGRAATRCVETAPETYCHYCTACAETEARRAAA